MRNKFAYSCSIKIHALEFHELLESIFCLLLVVEAFSLQKTVEVLEEVVVGCWEVSWIWWMRQNSVAQFVQLLKHWLCDVRSDVIRRCHGELSPFLLTSVGCRRFSFQCISSICWADTSAVMVLQGFRKPWYIGLAADHQTVTTASFQCKFGCGKCFGASLQSSHQASRHQLSHKVLFSSHVALWLRNGSLLLHRAREDTSNWRLCTFSVSLWDTHLLSFFTSLICFKCQTTVEWSALSSSVASHVLRGWSLMIFSAGHCQLVMASHYISQLQGCRLLCKTSWTTTALCMC